MTFTLKSEERFFNHVAMWPNGCWWWLGSNMGKMKYGIFWFEGKKVIAHRWAYERFIGPIPEGYESHHTCKTAWCVNPYHLEMMSRAEHSQTKNYHHPSKCLKGHKLSGNNLRIRRRLRSGGEYNERVCLTCKRERDNEFYARKHSGRKGASVDRRVRLA
jgi:hypothetical protein